MITDRLSLKTVASLLALLLVPFTSHADELFGTIGDTVIEAGETRVTGDVTVGLNSTVTIEPGAKLVFDGPFSLTVNGFLQAEGTASDPVIFTSNSVRPAAGDWGQIHFKNVSASSSASTLDHVVVQYASTGIKTESGSMFGETLKVSNTTIQNVSETGISVSDTLLELNGDVTIRDFGSYGIYVTGGPAETTVANVKIEQTGSRIRSGSCVRVQDGAMLEMTGSIVQRCGVGIDVRQRNGRDIPQQIVATGNKITGNNIGIRVRPQSSPRSGARYPSQFEVTGNTIAGNVDYELAIYEGTYAESTELNVTGNWWGTRDRVTIAERIRDQNDDDGSALAKFTPYMESENLF